MPEEDQIKILRDQLRAACSVIDAQTDALIILKVKLAKCRTALQGFVNRVDAGEIKSRRTYTAFKAILEETP